MSEVIVRLTSDHIKVKGGEYVRDLVRCRDCKYYIDNLTEDDTDEIYDGCRWDWKRKIPSADDFCSYGEREEQTMSNDLIKRSDAIKAYNEAMDELVKWQMEEWQLGDFSECEFNTTDCKHIVRKLEAIPSADRPQGEWIYTNDPLRLDDEWACNRCGNISFVRTNFCDRCGARMKGADDES